MVCVDSKIYKTSRIKSMEKVEKMSFFTKIFQTKKTQRKHECKWTLSEQSKGWSPPIFNRDNVRLVVINQNQQSAQGGRVLFDSKSEARSNPNPQEGKKRNMCRSAALFKPKTKVQSQSDTAPPCRERRARLASDVKVLEEMMFGSAPIIPKGSSLKVHATRNPPQLMVTKLFLSTDTNKGVNSEPSPEGFDLYSVQSMSMESIPRQIVSPQDCSQQSLAQSVPVDVPMHAKYSSEDNDDSGFSASMTSTGSCSGSFTTSGYSPSSSASMNSLNSLTRRLLRNQTTSLDSSINKRFSDDSEAMPARKIPSRLGIGITFTLQEGDAERFRHFESFFFSHITLIEGHVVKLKVAVEKALQEQKKHMVTEALEVFKNSVYDLYTAPRLTEPVWLNMMQYNTRQVALSHSFLKDFVSCIDKYDTKNHKFFMSTLITTILTHHLAWVPTVTPAGASPARTYLDKHSAKWLDALARSHPYNPLWAQLGDLYGAIGFPLQLSRTVVVGQKTQAAAVCKLLQVLSYFIRCSEVQQNTETRDPLDNMDGHMDIPGSGMRTIEEDELSESGDGDRFGKMCGSATSLGTIRHVAMQTSTETVLSARSDRTVIEQSRDLKKMVSFSEGVSDCGCGSANEACHPDDGKSFCPQCRESRASDSMCHSIVYSFEDGLPCESRNTVMNCDCPICEDQRHKSKLPEDRVQDCSDSESGSAPVPGNMAAGMQIKALKLFRMLSHDPTEDNDLGEVDICESSFCDTPATADSVCTPASADSVCTPASADSVCTPASAEDIYPEQVKPTAESFSSISLSRTDDKFFSLHDSDKSLTTIEECCPTESPKHQAEDASILTEQERSKCSSNHVNNTESIVQVERVRHVGNMSSNSISDPAICTDLYDSVQSFDPIKIDNSEAPNDMRTSHSSLLQLLDPNNSSSDSQESLVANTSEVTQEKGEEAHPTIAVTQSTESLTSPTRSGSNTSIYPCISENILEGTGTNVTSRLTDSRSSIEEELYRNPSLLEEPGGIKLIKDDPGTLYPKIEGNTVISSLRREPQPRAQSIGAGAGSESASSGLTTRRDTEEDEVFLENGEQSGSTSDGTVEDLFSGDEVTVHHNRIETLTSAGDSRLVDQVFDELERDFLTPINHNEPGEATRSSTQGHSPNLVSDDKVKAWLGSHQDVDVTPVQDVLRQDKHTNLKRDLVEPEKRTSREDVSVLLGKDAAQTLSHAKVHLLKRGNSMFDEYFDQPVDLPDPVELEQKALSSITACTPFDKTVSHVSSCISSSPTSAFDDFTLSMDIISDSDNGAVILPLEGPICMMDEYFTGDAEPLSLPDCASKEMVTSRLSLMQETPIQEADLSLDGLLDPHESRSRSNSESSTSRHRHGLERQHSSGSALSRQNSLGAGTPARTRSVTPTELSRRRHVSATSNVSWDVDPLEARNNMKEIPMPRVTMEEDSEEGVRDELNFGHSLMAGYTDHYMSDFVLHGTSDTNFHSKLHTDLNIAVQNSVLDEEIAQACCIVADIDKCSVKLSSCQKSSADRVKPTNEPMASRMVSEILESVQRLWKLKMSPEFCLMHLEDRLQEIYFKSKALSEYILVHRRINQKELNTMLGVDVSDLHLLLAVAATHTPSLAHALGPLTQRA